MIWVLMASLLNLSRFDYMAVDSLRNLLILAAPSHLLIFQDTGTAAFALQASLPLAGMISDLNLQGDTLYAGSLKDGGCIVQAVDLRSPRYPALLWSQRLFASVPAARVRIQKRRDTLYVGCGPVVVALDASTGSSYPYTLTLPDSEGVMDLEIHPDSPYVWIGTNRRLLQVSLDLANLVEVLPYSAHPLLFDPDSQWLVVGSWRNLLTVLDVASPSAPSILLDRYPLVNYWELFPLNFFQFGRQVASGPYRFSLDSLPPPPVIRNPWGTRMSWFYQGAWMFLLPNELRYQGETALPAWLSFGAVGIFQNEGHGLFSLPDTDSVVIGYVTFHPDSLKPTRSTFLKIPAPVQQTFRTFLHPPYAGVLVGSPVGPDLHLYRVVADTLVEAWVRRFTRAYGMVGDTNLLLVLRTTSLSVVDPGLPGVVGNAPPPCDTVTDAVWRPPYAYFLCGDTLKAYDLSDPAAPTPAGAWALPATGKQMAQDGRWMTVLLEGNQVQVLDMNAPLNPVEANVFPLPFYAGAMALSGARLFLSAYPPRVEIFRVPDGTWLHTQPLEGETGPPGSLLPTSTGVLAVYSDHLHFEALPATFVTERFLETGENMPIRLLPGGIQIMREGPVLVVDALGRVRFQGETRGTRMLRLSRGVYTVMFSRHQHVRVVIP